jgi:hypothetical protein
MAVLLMARRVQWAAEDPDCRRPLSDYTPAMKALRPFLVIGAVVVILLLVLFRPWQGPPPLHAESAAFGEVRPGVPLTAGLVSYVDEAAVRERLPELSVITRILRPATVEHPPRNLLTLEQRGFEHLGVRGRLTLDFFNDRLMEVTFYPDSAAEYAAPLAAAETGLQRQASGRREGVAGHRRVVSNVEQLTTDGGRFLGSTPFTLWQDRRLRAELDDWDRRFGHLAPPTSP